MAGSIFIDDGQTLTGKWDAAPDGRYPGGTFQYRMALGEWRDKYRLAPASQTASVRAELLAKHVISITPSDPDAEPGTGTIKLDADQWKRMRPDIQLAIIDYVLDYTAAEKQEKNSVSG